MFLFLYMNPILIAAAVIPAIVLLVQVYRADRLEPEPPVLLLSLVLYGIFATGLAMLTEELGSALLDRSFPRSSTAYNVLMYFVVVAFSEEGFKYLLLKKRTWRSPAFNCQFDGVVYAVFVSLGFAHRLCHPLRTRHRAGAGGDGGAGTRLLRRLHGRVVRTGQAV